MRSTIFHLIGPPGVGKYTVGTEVARLTGARLIDNHSIANVIFNVIGADGMTPLPAGIWPYVGRVRKAVLDSVTELAPPEASFVFTNFIRGDDAGEYAAFMEVAAIADARGSLFVPVILSCDTGELVTRIVRPDRAARMKLVDPVQGAHYNDGPSFRTDHPNALLLDVSSTPPEDAAHTIVEWATVAPLAPAPH
jgi:hypothetical protein